MAKHSLGKRIALDALGILLILISPIVGLLPGPGGIPLILAGLGLLSINEPWAQRWLHYVRENSEGFRQIFFPDNKIVQWAWDLFVVALIVAGTLINIYLEGSWLKYLSIPMFAATTVIFLFNRHRMRWIEKKIRKNK